jgi:uncharacterized caspase-like protein
MSGKYALIIGNTEYSDVFLEKLNAPGKDVENLAKILADKDICGFDEVKVLLNKSSFNIIEAIEDFAVEKSPDDVVVVYFSGHGVRDDGGALYLAATNTKLSRLLSTSIQSDYVRKAMDKSPSNTQVLILDCCFSGAFLQGGKGRRPRAGENLGTGAAFNRNLGYGRVILTASDSTQLAWIGEKFIGETENSLFTHYFIEGLRGQADSNDDGEITVDELYAYVDQKVRLASPIQKPLIHSSNQHGRLVLARVPYTTKVRPVALDLELIAAMKDARAFIREAAIEQLQMLLENKDNDPGKALSARMALEKISKEDASRILRETAEEILLTYPDPREKQKAPPEPDGFQTRLLKMWLGFIESVRAGLKKQTLKITGVFVLLSFIFLMGLTFFLKIITIGTPNIEDTRSISYLYTSNGRVSSGDMPIFYDNEDVYISFSLNDVPADTPLKAKWYYHTEIFGKETYLLMAITTYKTVAGDDGGYFYVNDPVFKGNYRVEVYANNNLAGIQYFTIH